MLLFSLKSVVTEKTESVKLNLIIIFLLFLC